MAVIDGYKKPKRAKGMTQVPSIRRLPGDMSINPSLLPREEAKKIRNKKVKQAIPGSYYAPAPTFLTSGNIRRVTTRR